MHSKWVHSGKSSTRCTHPLQFYAYGITFTGVNPFAMPGGELLWLNTTASVTASRAEDCAVQLTVLLSTLNCAEFAYSHC